MNSKPTKSPLSDNLGCTPIIPQGYYDEEIPNLLIGHLGVGEYLVKLGNNESGGEAESLKYSFDASECNSNFIFNYLVVFEDPDHDPSEQPFFQFTITDDTTGEEIKSFKKRAENDNDYFFTFDNGLDPIRYTDWVCEQTDLSDRIGHRISIKFIVADCSIQGHFGYVYIDGLCNSLEDSSPTPIISGLYDVYCLNQEIKIDGSQSYGFNRHGWQVCLLQNGVEVDCTTQTDVISGNAGVLDVRNFYNNSAYSIACGNTYRVKLILTNDCVPSATTSMDITIICKEGVDVEYFDILNCLGSQSDIQIEGINDCTGCLIQWEPSQYLNSSSVAFPIIEGTLNTDALSQTYHVIVEDDNGCIDEESVNIFYVDGFDFEASMTRDLCGYTFTGILTSDRDIPSSHLVIDFINLQTGQIFTGISDDPSQILSQEFNLSTGLIEGDLIDDGFWVARLHLESVGTSVTNCTSMEIDLGEITNADIFHGPMIFIINNLISPNGDGINDVFRPFSPVPCENPNADPLFCESGHNALNGKMSIFNRWGQLVFEQEATSTPGVPFDPMTLAWDGNVDGSPAPSDEYIYSFRFTNCTYSEEEVDCEGTEGCPQGTPSPSNDDSLLHCNCTMVNGAFTLVR